MNPLWSKNGRLLILYATTEPWKLDRGEEEIGDVLYPLDPGLVIERAYGTVLLVYSSLDPWRAFREVIKYPPAYVSRILPVEAHLRPSLEEAADVVRRLTEVKGVKGPVELEVRVRGECLDEEKLYERVADTLPGVRRKAGRLLRVEFACPIGVAGIVYDRLDRVEAWRR